MERFFVMMGRLNSVLLLLVLLGAAAVMAFMILGGSRPNERDVVGIADVGNGTRKPVRLRLQNPEHITGAHTLMLELTTAGESGKYYSSGGYGSETRNILFLTQDDKAGRWLFKDHQRLILTAKQLSEEKRDKDEDYPSRAIYLEYVERDTDGDGKLSKEDAATIGFTQPDGTGFVPVLKDVRHVFSHAMADPGHVAIVFQAGAKVRHARISVADFKIMSDQEVIDVPATL